MEIKDIVIDTTRYLLKPVVRFLLRHGVTFAEFAELAKDTYVETARDDYGIQGRPTNNSRVAMLTGLSRREVAKVRDRLLEGGEDADALRGNRISRILTGWHTDDEFTDDGGRPKALPESGDDASLERLFRRYGGDLPFSAVRKEMQQLGLTEADEDGKVRVLKRDYVYSELDPEIVKRMGVALHDHAATLEHNLNEQRESAPRFEAIADNAKISARALNAFGRLVESRGLEFLEEIDGWLADHEIDESKDAGAETVRLGVGVYLIQDEGEQGKGS